LFTCYAGSAPFYLAPLRFAFYFGVLAPFTALGHAALPARSAARCYFYSAAPNMAALV
jgi:hypothetical protein